jgi:UDP-galactopyranose mutase
MTHFLNILSVLAALIFGTGAVYLLLNYTVGRLKFLNSRFEWNGLQIKDFVFLAVGLFVILFFTSFVKPY